MIDLIFVALLQAAAGDPAQPSQEQQQAPAATAQTTAEQAPAADQGEVRCRREQITGTRLTQRVCRTAAEDQRIRDESRDMLQRQQQMMSQQSN